MNVRYVAILIATVMLLIVPAMVWSSEDSEAITDLGTYGGGTNESDPDNAYSYVHFQFSPTGSNVPDNPVLYVLVGATIIVEYEQSLQATAPTLRVTNGQDIGMPTSPTSHQIGAYPPLYAFEWRGQATTIGYATVGLSTGPGLTIRVVSDTPMYEFELIYISSLGGTIPDDEKVTSDTTPYTFTISSQVPQLSGYEFQGWDTDISADTVVYDPGDELTTGSSVTRLYAVWDQIVTYELNFDDNGGSGGPSDLSYGPTTDTSHRFTIPSQTPQRDGYDFQGWGTSSSGSAQYDPLDNITLYSSSPTDTLYAIWEEIPYTPTYILYFDDNGGSGGPGQLTYGPTTSLTHTFTIPQTVPTWSGRDFLGWSRSANGSGELYQPGETIRIGATTEDVVTFTLYAAWTDGGYIYTLTFNANGGSSAPDSLTYGPTQESLHYFTIPDEVPIWSEHAFVGWTTTQTDPMDPELYFQPGESVPVESTDRDEILYAQWRDAPTTTYIVNFNANGGSGAPPSINSGPISVTTYHVDIPETVPTWANHVFLGWSEDQDATDGTYEPGDSFTLTPTGESTVTMNLYAIWATQFTFTLEFDANGGSGAPDSLTYGPTTDTSHVFVIPDQEPTREGYIFQYWSSYPNGATDVMLHPGDNATVRASDSPDATRTLYARWAPTTYEFTLEFSASGGSGAPPTMESGVVTTPYYTFTIPETVPTKEGYTFTGWNDTQAHVIYQPGQQITLTSSFKVLYAIWEGQEYDYYVYFDANGGFSAPNPLDWTTVETSWTFTIPEVTPSRDNHTFIGWSTSATGEVEYDPGDDITLTAPDHTTETLYAIWESNTETVVYLIGPSAVNVGDTIEITASVSPDGSGGVTWQRVSGADLIDDIQTSSTTWTATATAVGSITIRATATDGSGANEDITIQITDVPVSGDVTVQIAGSTSARVGETRTLTAVVLPSDLGNRTVTWKIVTGSELITYETSETWRGGEFTYEATGTGTVTITATSAADPDAAATITITIGSATSDDSEVIGPQGIVGALGAALFGGSSSIAGVVLFAIILAVLFAIIREPLPVVLLGIPVLAIFTLLGILDMDMVILLIIVVTVGLALIARKMWRD